MSEKPLLSIVVTGHGSGPEIYSFLDSLNAQRKYSSAAHSRNPKIECPFAKATHWQTQEYPNIEVILSWDGECPISERHTRFGEIKVIENEKQGGCGHHTRGPGIAAATGDFIYLTNCDNQVVHGWLDAVLPRIVNPTVCMVYYDVLNNLWAWTNLGGSKLKRGHIDLSATVVRSEIAKEVGFPYLVYDGDYDYIRDCSRLIKSRGFEIQYIPQTLGIHN